MYKKCTKKINVDVQKMLQKNVKEKDVKTLDISELHHCSNINFANIYRQIDNDGSTIVLDEFEDMYGEAKQEMIKLLNQGFNKDAIVPRCVGQNNQIKKFRAFAPKIMGGISNIDDVLYERCIKYTTKRVKGVKITKYRETQKNLREMEDIIDDLYIFGLTYVEKIKSVYDNEEVYFEGNTLREDDLWNPLLCIAKILDEEDSNLNIQQNLLSYAEEQSKEKFKRNLDNDQRLQLLYYLHEYTESDYFIEFKLNNGTPLVDISEIYNYISNIDEFSWIKSKSSLGKKLTQWYGFEKKRLLSHDDVDQNTKKTYYIFDKEIIEKIMQDSNISQEDFE